MEQIPTPDLSRPDLSRRFAILTGIPGLSAVTAFALLN